MNQQPPDIAEPDIGAPAVAKARRRAMAIGAVALGAVVFGLGGCDDIRATAEKGSAVRMCKARAEAAGLDLSQYEIRDIIYQGPDSGDHFVAMIADSTPPPDHLLVCQLGKGEAGAVVVSASWDRTTFVRGDRWDKATGKWVRVARLRPAGPARQSQAALPAVSGRYYNARVRLLALGYQPLSVNTRRIAACLKEQKSGEGLSLDEDCPDSVIWPEIADCAGTGLGYCQTYWKDPAGRIVSIITAGEPQPGVIERVEWASVEALADLKISGALE